MHHACDPRRHLRIAQHATTRISMDCCFAPGNLPLLPPCASAFHGVLVTRPVVVSTLPLLLLLLLLLLLVIIFIIFVIFIILIFFLLLFLNHHPPHHPSRLPVCRTSRGACLALASSSSQCSRGGPSCLDSRAGVGTCSARP